MTPELILVMGPSGAGKTTWIDAHAEQLPGRWYRIDAEPLLAALQVGGPYWDAAARALGKAVYEAAVQAARAKRLNAIIAHRGMTRHDRDLLLQPWRDAGYRIRIVVIVPDDPETPIQRARADPTRPRSSLGVWCEMVERFYRLYEPVSDDEADEVTRL